MARLEVLTEALAQAWINGEPDGLLFKELMNEIDLVDVKG